MGTGGNGRVRRSFIWEHGQTETVFGTWNFVVPVGPPLLYPYRNNTLLDINESGTAVGYLGAGPGNRRIPIVREAGRPVQNLNDLIANPKEQQVLFDLYGINDFGQIIGCGASNFESICALLDPVQKGDINCDGSVDVTDLEVIELAIGSDRKYFARFPYCDPLLGDLDGDGRVSEGDFQGLIEIVTKKK